MTTKRVWMLTRFGGCGQAHTAPSSSILQAAQPMSTRAGGLESEDHGVCFTGLRASCSIAMGYLSPVTLLGLGKWIVTLIGTMVPTIPGPTL